jgi:Fe-S cluster biogenesis protein NfuA
MFIQTQATNDPDTMEFVPGRDVLANGPLAFNAPEEAARSPLAARLFELDQVRGVQLNPDNVGVTKAPNAEWLTLKPHVLAAVMQHFTEGRPVLDDAPAANGNGHGTADAGEAEGAMPDWEALEPVSDADEDLIAQVRELIQTRIYPAIQQTGGDIEFHSFVGSTVNLKLAGTAYAMLQQIETMLKHYVPEVETVQDYMDAIPKPGLDTETGQKVRQVLDERINPAVAGHGGHISLIDVRGSRVFLRLEGGCQGCAMSTATLKQGVEAEIKRVAPEISEILDITDHAAGTNPYYSGAGSSPVA